MTDQTTMHGIDLHTLARRIRRMEDVHEITNLMGRHEYLHSALMMEQEYEELFVRDAPGLTFEAEGLGVWEGREAVRALYVDGLRDLMNAHAAGMRNTFPDAEPGDPQAGMLQEHLLTTPVIEVAADGETAKGVWMSPGADAIAANGELQAHWVWVKYGVDFLKENGAWKIWHFHIYSTFYIPFEKSWVEHSLDDPAWDAPPEEWTAPDRPNTYHDPYSIRRLPRLAPAPPRPYRTFSETWSYADSAGPEKGNA